MSTVTRVDAGWTATSVALRNAVGIAWDTCHKIYVLMDEEQMRLMESYGYDPLLRLDNLDAGNPDRSPAHLQAEALRTLKQWWDDSCGLRFVNAVETNHDDPNAGFITLIGQFDDEDDEDDPDVYAWGSYDNPDDEEDD
jgi:hypothetical protein